MSFASRKYAIRTCTRTRITNEYRLECIAKARFNNELWTVWERSVLKTNETVENFIVLYVLLPQDGFWSYQQYDEEMNPQHYKCPVRFLELAPNVKSQRWRDMVVAQHKEAIRRKELVKQLKPGHVVRCSYVNPDRYVVMNLSPLVGRAYNGGVYRIPKTRVVEIVGHSGRN
jgi:hypothetical protein